MFCFPVSSTSTHTERKGENRRGKKKKSTKNPNNPHTIKTTKTTCAQTCYVCACQPFVYTNTFGGRILGNVQPQNHRMVGVGRDLWGSSSPIPLPKQVHLEQTAQDLVQVGFEYLQRRRIHNLSGEPVPVLHHPQSEEVLPHVQMELPMLQFVPIAPCPVAGHH